MGNNLYKDILIATDGSEHSKRAACHGIELAKLLGANVHSLYVLDKTSYAPSSFQKPIQLGSKWNVLDDILQEQGRDALQYIKAFAEEKDINVNSNFVEGHAAHEILEFAEKHGIDLIVVGTLGKSRLEKILLGSVANKIVRHSKVSVLVVGQKESVT